MITRIGQDRTGQDVLGRELNVLSIGPELDALTGAYTRPHLDWLVTCWAEGCGWEMKTRTEEAARMSKTEHECRQMGHRVTVVRV